MLAFNELQPGTNNLDIGVIENGTPRMLAPTEFNERAPRFSPDGMWIAYESDRSGQSEVYLTPYPGPGEEQLVSTGGGADPRWSPDGREIFYRVGAGQINSVSVRTTPSLDLGAPQKLFDIPDMVVGAGFDVHPDGQRFVVVRGRGSESGSTQINVVLNWQEEFTARQVDN